jgi:two-component system, NarL family, nitrate/nitrite response regulator NarL
VHLTATEVPTDVRRLGTRRVNSGEEVLPCAAIVTETFVLAEALRAVLLGSKRVDVPACHGLDDAIHVSRARAQVIALLCMPPPEGLVAARKLTRAGARVVVFGVRESEREIVAWAEAGALGCVARYASLSELVSTIEAVARGETTCSPSFANMLFRRASLPSRVALEQVSHDLGLTAREEEVRALVAIGLSNKQVAEALSLRPATVKNHVHNILRKIGVQKRTDILQLRD